MRPLLPTDADAYAALVRRAFAAWQVDPAPSALRVTGDDIRAHLAAGGGGVTTAPDIAGLLWSEKDGGLYISRVAVDPAHRRQGLANRMLAAAQSEATRRGLPHLWLSTRLAMTGNRRLFCGFGFEETTQHAHPGYSEPTFVDMMKRIRHELLEPSDV
ncbi:GNAT family N-acetyltransferase [Acidisphaera sp. L21]|uniref:GNAT family N-acetyltransferase n=1 Tax=Acidisphaera sp. L21 TaxID=1641851 RepID=UPI00131C323D|nr:GNAT family N-acetyltransferase [Acidisphaera sp. L21]